MRPRHSRLPRLLLLAALAAAPLLLQSLGEQTPEIPVVSAEEVMRRAQAALPRPEELDALQLQLLRQQVDKLPLRIENSLSARIAEILINQIRSWLIDPTQAAVLNATMQGTFNPIGARMVHFRGHDLLVVSPKNDEYVGGHILATGTPFQPHLLGPMLDFIRPASTVVDAGANLGSYSVFFAAATGPKGRVYSFEPQRKMFEVLCANAIVNGLLNVFPQHVALSFGPGSVQMSAKVPDGSSIGVNLTQAEEQGMPVNYGGMSLGAGGEEVEAATLDSYNLTGVSLLKVDVQGAEQLLFYGAQDTIRRNLPVVVFENSAEFTVTAEMNATMHIPGPVHAFNISSYLRSLGYQPAPEQPSEDDVFLLPPNHPALMQAGLVGAAKEPRSMSIGRAAKGAAGAAAGQGEQKQAEQQQQQQQAQPVQQQQPQLHR